MHLQYVEENNLRVSLSIDFLYVSCYLLENPSEKYYYLISGSILSAICNGLKRDERCRIHCTIL